jgi:hypothetical protein
VIVPGFPTQHLCSRFKSSFIHKNHHIWELQLLIPHKQNPHIELEKLAVTAKISSHSGTELCVETTGFESWQTDFHGLHERIPWLVQHSGHPWTQTTFVIHQRKEKYSNYIMVQSTSDSASKYVGVMLQMKLSSVCMQYNIVAIRLYKGTEVMFLMTLLYSQINTATSTEAMLCNTWHYGLILHWPM